MGFSVFVSEGLLPAASIKGVEPQAFLNMSGPVLSVEAAPKNSWIALGIKSTCASSRAAPPLLL